jgi:hypothetical protein
MPQSWIDLLKLATKTRLSEAGAQDSVWRMFTELAHSSADAETLGGFLSLGTVLPPAARALLAFSVARLMVANEWPANWVPKRDAVTGALRSIVQELDPDQPDSVAALFQLAESSWFVQARVGLIAAIAILSRPCPPVELPQAAVALNLSLVLLISEVNTAFARRPQVTEQLTNARRRLLHAFARYGTAANELNSETGAVFFTAPASPFIGE